MALDDGDVSEDAPRVGLEEMMREMRISDGGREEGGGGGVMVTDDGCVVCCIK